MLVQHDGSGFSPLGWPQHFNAVVIHSLLYGMVQLDTSPKQSWVNGYLVPIWANVGLVVCHKCRECGTESDISGVEDNTDPVALVAS